MDGARQPGRRDETQRRLAHQRTLQRRAQHRQAGSRRIQKVESVHLHEARPALCRTPGQTFPQSLGLMAQCRFEIDIAHQVQLACGCPATGQHVTVDTAGLAGGFPAGCASAGRNHGVDPDREPGRLDGFAPYKCGGNRHPGRFAEKRPVTGRLARHGLPDGFRAQFARRQNGRIDPPALQGRGQRLGSCRSGVHKPRPHLCIPARGGHHRVRPVVALPMQLRGEHAAFHPFLQGCANGGKTRIGQGPSPVLRHAGFGNPCAIRHLEHHAQRHQGGLARLIAQPVQHDGQLIECVSLFQGTGTPVITFKDQQGMAHHRLAPASDQRPGKGHEYPAPQPCQPEWHPPEQAHEYPMRADTAATSGITRSILSRLRPSFHLSSRISEKAL